MHSEGDGKLSVDGSHPFNTPIVIYPNITDKPNYELQAAEVLLLYGKEEQPIFYGSTKNLTICEQSIQI
jgi:hypothetical protein